MKRNLGFDTPAKRLEALSKQMEVLSKQLEKLPVSVEDATKLAGFALYIAFSWFAAENPQRARPTKDAILRVAESWNIASELRQWIANLLMELCDIAEKKIKS